MKKLLCSQILVLVLLFILQGVGHATLLSYDYSGSFYSGPLVGESFSGSFDYETSGDPADQDNQSSLTAGGNTYYAPTGTFPSLSFIQASGNQVRQAAISTTVGDFVIWELFVYFNPISVDLSQPLPLDHFVGSSFEFIRSADLGDCEGEECYQFQNLGTLSLLGGVAPVPEPATLLLLGSGLIGLVGFRRKFSKG